MIFILERITQPDIEPVTLAELKTHLREFSSLSTDKEDQLTSLVTAGREWVEDYTGRALIEQQWRLTIDQNRRVLGDIVGGFSMQPGYANFGGYGWYSGVFRWERQREILLHKAPILSITKFVTVAADNTETDVDTSTYALLEPDSKWPRIVALSGAAWTASTLRIEYRAGFADRTGSPQQGAEVVPVRFKQAIKLWAEANYDRSKDMMQILLDAAQNVVRLERSEAGFG
jgi:hypothetical protein